jgi:mono/diheme cytochrome c family protein
MHSRIGSIGRWAARIVGALVMLLAVAVGVVYAASERRFRKHFEIPTHLISVPKDSAGVARGEHVATIRGCTACHGIGLVGHVEVEDPMLGRLAGPNLTNGGRGAALTDADWERAVRHGVRRDGAPLLIMPAFEHTGMSDEDLGALIAYARSLPGANVIPPPSKAGPVLRGLFTAGMVLLLSAEQIDHAKPHPQHVDAEPTAEYGDYLAAMCKGCHGPQLSGGKIPGGPPDWKPAANITRGGNIGRWSETDFITALRTGRRPDGSTIDTQMPWQNFAKMNDTELRAIYAYLRAQPVREYGNR